MTVETESPQGERERMMEEFERRRIREYETDHGVTLDATPDRLRDADAQVERESSDGDARFDAAVRAFDDSTAALAADREREAAEVAEAESRRQTTANFLDALYEGDQDEASAAFDAAVNAALPATRQSSGQFDPDAILDALEQRREIRDALGNFATQYPEIFRDEHLADLADRHLDANLQSGNYSTFGDAVLAAGESVRDWMESKGATGKSRNAASAISANRSTPSSIISEMRRQRGQA